MDSRLGALDFRPDTHKIHVSTSIAEITGAIYCFFIACSSWDIGSKHPVGINIEKAWNLLAFGDYEIYQISNHQNKR